MLSFPSWLGTLVWAMLLQSIACFTLLGWDKRQAKLRRERVSEVTLHTFELLGGWPGSWIAQILFRHKNQQPSYRFTFRLIVLFHVVVGFLWLFPDWR